MNQTPNTPKLGGCQGFHVLADDGFVGEVEQPLIPSDGDVPDYLVVRMSRRWLRNRMPVVSTAHVSGFDSARRIVWVHGRRAEIAALPEELPLAL